MRSCWNKVLPWKLYTTFKLHQLVHLLQKKVFEYILLNATAIIEALEFYSTNKMKHESNFGKLYTKIYPTHQ